MLLKGYDFKIVCLFKRLWFLTIMSFKGYNLKRLWLSKVFKSYDFEMFWLKKNITLKA